MRSGICKLCLQHGPLCDSHALPNSLFNYVLRKNAGKAIVLTDDATTPAYYSSDTWETELLCEACEGDLNRRYDAYGLAVFRGHEGRVRIHDDGVDLLNIDRRRLRMFFLSVLWRVSVSTHPNYANIDLPHEWEEDLRLAIHHGRTVPESRYTVFMCKMRDSSPVGAFDNEALRGFIAAPFGRRYDTCLSVCFPFLSFFVETFFPKVPRGYEKRRGVIQGLSPVLPLPYVEILDVPEIVRMLTSALRKHLEGSPGAA